MFILSVQGQCLCGPLAVWPNNWTFLPQLPCTALHCTALKALHCTVLHWLHWLHFPTLHWLSFSTLPYSVLLCTALHRTTLYRLHCTTLNFLQHTALQCTALHRTTLYRLHCTTLTSALWTSQSLFNVNFLPLWNRHLLANPGTLTPRFEDQFWSGRFNEWIFTLILVVGTFMSDYWPPDPRSTSQLLAWKVVVQRFFLVIKNGTDMIPQNQN